VCCHSLCQNALHSVPVEHRCAAGSGEVCKTVQIKLTAGIRKGDAIRPYVAPSEDNAGDTRAFRKG
jgi:hypothetical protein